MMAPAFNNSFSALIWVSVMSAVNYICLRLQILLLLAGGQFD